MSTTTEEFPSGGAGTKIAIEMRLPNGSGTHPAVLVLHGTYGLELPFGPAIESFADALVAKRIGAAIPRYFDTTGTTPGPGVGPSDILTNLPAWRRACADALAFLAAHSRIDPGRLGLLGFSLGGHLSLDLGMAPPPSIKPKCVVDFFGPTLGMDGTWPALPPVLIHHGDKDTDVPLAHSDNLVQHLKRAGKIEGRDYTLIKYPGQGHGFAGSALSDSRDATVKFFERYL
jgi:dienelactone hydrolase